MIDWNRQGLRLGYLLRGALHDAAGAEQAIRVCGPAARIGTGHVGPDPDAPAGPGRYWRAARGEVTLIDDAGKLDQHIGIPGQLDVEIPISYPEDARAETADPTGDEVLRSWALDGRWANRRVDVWLVDLDTGDTEHRFRGAWDRHPSMLPGGASISAREYLGPLAAPWPGVPWPQDTSAWTETRFAGAPDSAYYPGAYLINPAHRRVRVSPVFGSGEVVGEHESVWREILPYGFRGVVGGGTFWWAHVSAQEACFVHEIAVQVIGLGSGGVSKIAPSFTFLNAEPAAGPLGTNIRFGTTVGVTFSPATARHRVFARISGPPAGQPTATPIGNGAKTEYEDTGTPLAAVEDILAAHVSDATSALSMQIPDAFGSSALGDFAAARPYAVDEWKQYQCAVPVDLSSAVVVARDVVADLMRSVPADLVRRYDTATGERRLWPWWRRPRIGEVEDFTIGPADLASAAPVSVRQSDDPYGEYATTVRLAAAASIGEPQSTNSGDLIDDLDPEQNRSIGLTSAQAVSDDIVDVSRAVDLEWWAHTVSATRDGLDTAMRAILGEHAQRQRWTEATLGGRWYRLQIGDTLRYAMHGVTSSVGMVRRLEYDLERQLVVVSACHVVHYPADAAEED